MAVKEDAKLKLLQLPEVDPVRSRLEAILLLLKEWGLDEDYHCEKVYERVEIAIYFWDKYLEEFVREEE